MAGRTWRQRLKDLGYSPRVVHQLQEVCKALAIVDDHGLAVTSHKFDNVFPRLPLELDKLGWLCRLDAKQLKALLERLDLRTISRKRIIEEVRPALGEEPTPAKVVGAGARSGRSSASSSAWPGARSA